MSLPSRPSSLNRIDQLLDFLREALEPFVGDVHPLARVRVGEEREASIVHRALMSELALVRDLVILRSGQRRSQSILGPESSKPSEVEPGFSEVFWGAMAREVLDLHSPQPGDLKKLDSLWDFYRAAILLSLQLPIFSDVTRGEQVAARGRLAVRYVWKWNTTSRTHGGISPEAQQGLQELQEVFDINRPVAKWVALTVGIDWALARWHEPRRIRLGQHWIHEDGEVAEKGLDELTAVEYLLYRVEEPLDPVDGSLELLKPVQGFMVLHRHVRRRAIEGTESWLESRLESWESGALLADAPDGIEPDFVSLGDALLDPQGFDDALFQPPAVLEASETEHSSQWPTVESQATDQQRRYLRIALKLHLAGLSEQEALREAAVRLYPEAPRHQALANGRALRNRLRERVSIFA